MTTPSRPALRLAELVATLSLGTDLGLGQPMEHMIRACLIALRLGESFGLSEAERQTVYYSGLLAWVGCHTDAYEQAKWFGDDALLKSDAHYRYDLGKVGPSVAFMLKHVGGQGRPLTTRARVGVGFLGEGRKALMALADNHYQATDELTERLGHAWRWRDRCVNRTIRGLRVPHSTRALATGTTLSMFAFSDRRRARSGMRKESSLPACTRVRHAAVPP